MCRVVVPALPCGWDSGNRIDGWIRHGRGGRRYNGRGGCGFDTRRLREPMRDP
jgi:hypothetical protein